VSPESFLNAEDLEDALEAWRWPVSIDPQSGDVVGIEFTGEKLGDEELLFKAIAPYVTEGSYTLMVGEDGEIWKWVFGSGGCEKKLGRLVFD